MGTGSGETRTPLDARLREGESLQRGRCSPSLRRAPAAIRFRVGGCNGRSSNLAVDHQPTKKVAHQPCEPSTLAHPAALVAGKPEGVDPFPLTPLPVDPLPRCPPSLPARARALQPSRRAHSPDAQTLSPPLPVTHPPSPDAQTLTVAHHFLPSRRQSTNQLIKYA